MVLIPETVSSAILWISSLSSAVHIEAQNWCTLVSLSDEHFPRKENRSHTGDRKIRDLPRHPAGFFHTLLSRLLSLPTTDWLARVLSFQLFYSSTKTRIKPTLAGSGCFIRSTIPWPAQLSQKTEKIETNSQHFQHIQWYIPRWHLVPRVQ
jgi:hypothetical protein